MLSPRRWLADFVPALMQHCRRRCRRPCIHSMPGVHRDCVHRHGRRGHDAPGDVSPRDGAGADEAGDGDGHGMAPHEGLPHGAAACGPCPPGRLPDAGRVPRQLVRARRARASGIPAGQRLRRGLDDARLGGGRRPGGLHLADAALSDQGEPLGLAASPSPSRPPPLPLPAHHRVHPHHRH